MTVTVTEEDGRCRPDLPAVAAISTKARSMIFQVTYRSGVSLGDVDDAFWRFRDHFDQSILENTIIADRVAPSPSVLAMIGYGQA